MRQLMRLICHILRLFLVVPQGGQRANEIYTGVEDAQPRRRSALLVRPQSQKFPHRQPSGHTVVPGLCQCDAILKKYFRRAFPRVLPAVPQVGRCQPCVYIVITVYLQHPPRRLADDVALFIGSLAIVPALV